ncbi:hypothetical protein GCM10023405_11270 [Streptomonospora salina]
MPVQAVDRVSRPAATTAEDPRRRGVRGMCVDSMVRSLRCRSASIALSDGNGNGNGNGSGAEAAGGGAGGPRGRTGGAAGGSVVDYRGMARCDM